MNQITYKGYTGSLDSDGKQLVGAVTINGQLYGYEAPDIFSLLQAFYALIDLHG